MEHIIKDIVNGVNYNKELYRLKGVSITSVFEDAVDRSDEDEYEGNGSIDHIITESFNKIVELYKKSEEEMENGSTYIWKPMLFKNQVLDNSKVNNMEILQMKNSIRNTGFWETKNQKRDVKNYDDDDYDCLSTKYIITAIDKLN